MKHDPFAALRFVEFRFFVAARFLMTIAIQMQSVIVGWEVYSITKDPLALGLVGLAEAIPAISIAPFAGHIIDKNDRKKIARISLFCTTLFSLGLLVVTSNKISLSIHNNVWFIYFFVFMSGLARGFLGPSIFSLLAHLVPREIYTNSSTWNSTIWQTGAVIGPAFGGLLYAFVGVTNTFIIMIILLLFANFCFGKISDKPIGIDDEEPFFKSITKGLKFVFKHEIILGALTLDLFAVLFGGAVALLPIFAKDILHAGPEGLGVLRAAPSVGAVITMLYLAYKPPVKNAGKSMMFATVGFGLCMIFFALSRNFVLSLLLLTLSGGFDSVSIVIRSTVLQLFTPEEMRGRVSAVNTMFIGSSNEIGGFESGVTAKLMGTVTSVVFGGTMTLLVVAIASWKAKGLKRLKL